MTTDQFEKQYLKDGGSRCPVCGSEDITGAAMDVEGEYHIQEMGCSVCDASWNDVFKLVGLSNLVHDKYVISVFLGGQLLTRVPLDIPIGSPLHVIEIDIVGLPDSDQLYCEDQKGFRYKRQIKNPGSTTAQFYKI